MFRGGGGVSWRLEIRLPRGEKYGGLGRRFVGHGEDMRVRFGARIRYRSSIGLGDVLRSTTTDQKRSGLVRYYELGWVIYGLEERLFLLPALECLGITTRALPVPLVSWEVVVGLNTSMTFPFLFDNPNISTKFYQSLTNNPTPGAQVPDLDTDVGTGKEGDVEARCFRECVDVFHSFHSLSPLLLFIHSVLNTLSFFFLIPPTIDRT